MIEQLHVRNFILVENLEIEFTAGFNVLTGETGAGKSILVGALSVLFGGKAGADLVRSGSDEAFVSGRFRVAGRSDVEEWLAARDISPEDDGVLVRRSIRRNGRGTIYIQSTPVTRAELEELASSLLDLHSQHEHQSLFVESSHRRLLDRFAGIEDTVEAFALDFSALSENQKALRDLKEREAEREHEIEIIEHALEEIEAAAIDAGEVEELTNERDRMVQFEKLAEHVQAITSLLGGDDAALALLKRARYEYVAAAAIDSDLTAESERLESMYFELEDVARSLTDYEESLRYDPQRLEQIEDRLALIKSLFRKYGDGPDKLAEYVDRSTERLEELRNAEERRDSLTAEIKRLEQRVTQGAKELSARRGDAARRIETAISDVLSELAMGQAAFVVAVEARTNDAGRLVYSQYGADRVRFLISSNPGEQPRPLVKIASGGEISRVMLAIKTVLAAQDEQRSLVFDEIDTGIGGQVALALASHMRRLADHTQVICITHLATIAVRADNHIVVEKNVTEGRTYIGSRSVTGEERTQEIARMLSGEHRSTSLEHARDLLERYRAEKTYGQN